ncbi:MAG: hypothetical protein SO214_03650 [Prevotella pectinovora]|uniref:hypothetical protein n=1 Tax=Prevotella pectinovora TaxID=1602169 RepID=UPI002A80C7E8|nr:hypothetical protein [Prevotella pectinovora]MDY4778541.1 hypothetical protein [Prevotella pectinovora]
MEELTHDAKIAVLRILNDIVNADNIVKDIEVENMNEIARSFELADNYMDEVNNLVTLQALSIVRALSVDLKEKIAQMMGKMIVIDEDINYNEVKLYNAVCKSCNIERDFNVEDYPGLTFSGPFVNPEDLMNII